MTTLQIQEITKIFNEGIFDYEYCGYKPDTSTMQDYLRILNSGNFTEEEVATQLNIWKKDIEVAMAAEKSVDFLDFAVIFIAHPIAQAKTKCIYEGVTFTF